MQIFKHIIEHTQTGSFSDEVRTECEHDYFVFCCSVLCEDEKQAVAVKSQLQQLARPMYSNPPLHGAQIVSTILGDPELKSLWLKEVKVTFPQCCYLLTYSFLRLAIYSMFHVHTLAKTWRLLSYVQRC